MTDNLPARLVPSPQAVDCDVGAETVILHTGSGIYFGLDPVGTQVWQMLKDGLLPDAICSAIAAGYGIDAPTAEADVARFLAELHTHGIVLDADA